MDIKVEGQLLHNALKTVSPACSNDFGILLDAKEGTLAVTAFSREMSIRVQVPATVKKSGSTVVYPAPLTTRVGELVASQVGLRSEKSTLLISGGTAKFRIGHLPPADFPDVEVPGNQPVPLDTEQFTAAASQVLPAASTDYQRPALTGILFNPEKGALALVATDSYRLAVSKLPSNEAFSGRIVVPSAALKALFRSCRGKDLQVQVNEKRIAFSGENFLLTAALFDSQYPNYTTLLSPTYKTRWTVSREALLGLLSRAKTALDGSLGSVSISIADGKATASLPDGNFEETIEGDLVGERVKFGVNPAFLSAGVSVCSAEKIVISANGPLKPVGVENEGDSSFTYVVMPVRL